MEERQEEQRKKEMLKILKERASSYVPEWRLDEENPDIGTALALVYTDMMTSVVSRYQRMMEKKQIDFLNAIGAELSPAVPAKGYVSFGLVNEKADGSQVPAGTYVTADEKTAENGMIPYVTQNDIFVSPTELSCIYEVNDQADYIGKCYDSSQNNRKTAIQSFVFHRTAPNLQEHVLYIGHTEVLNCSSTVWITLCFLNQGGTFIKEEQLNLLLDPEVTEITYSSEEGFLPFAKQTMQQGKLLLCKEERQPVFSKMNLNGEVCSWIRIHIRKIEPVRSFGFERIYLSLKIQDRTPDFVLADGMEADLNRYFPFGERLLVYNEVYFASNEILSKRGAKIELAFFLHFVPIPLENNGEEKEIKYDWVMEAADFEKQKEYEITIASVMWEYYNGAGWVRIYPDRTNEEVFQLKEVEKGRYVKLNFTCPMDIQETFVNSTQTYAIRGRITKLNNPYKLNGYYISPIIENTTLCCDYEENPVERLCMLSSNNLQTKRWKNGTIMPFVQMNNQAASLYLGFRIPPKGGPIKMYFKFRETVSRRDVNLFWEYWNGKKFVPLRVIDETMNFSKSGLITFLGAQDFEKTVFFGEKLYWMKIVDASSHYKENSLHVSAPFLEDVVMNTVKIRNSGMEQTEYFCMEYFVRHKKLHLQKKNIQSIHVYIKEQIIGSMESRWKEWTKVKDFIGSKESDCHYRLEPNKGIILFGDGISGRIPPVSKSDNIKVVYQCGGGLISNVEEGKVNKLRQSIGFINRVYNPEPLSGGLDTETREHAIKRCSNQIRLRNRAVTARDYESLAYEASRRIEKARCFPGRDSEGKKMHGAITLVLLLKDYRTGNSSFQGVRNTVEDYLKGRMPDTIYHAGKLFIIEPVFISFQVKADIRVNDFENAFLVQKQVEEKVNCFFDPIAGNFDNGGWELGYLPNMIQLRNIIHMTEHVEEIRSLFVTTYRHGRLGLEEVEPEEMKECPFVLPVNGVHQITVSF